MEKQEIIDLLKMMGKPAKEHYESDDLNELFAALAKAQGEMEAAKLDSDNPFYKSRYSDLASVIKASRPALTKHGLSIIQRVLPNDHGVMYMHTRLCHASGQWIESKVLINPPKQDIQTFGSYLTYLRRYSYSMVVCQYSGDIDDDGEAAMCRHDTAYGKPVNPEPKITAEQLNELVLAFANDKEKIQKTMDHYGLNKLSDLPSKHYDKIMRSLKGLINKKSDKS